MHTSKQGKQETNRVVKAHTIKQLPGECMNADSAAIDLPAASADGVLQAPLARVIDHSSSL